jgi:hypothetical protein
MTRASQPLPSAGAAGRYLSPRDADHPGAAFPSSMARCSASLANNTSQRSSPVGPGASSSNRRRPPAGSWWYSSRNSVCAQTCG